MSNSEYREAQQQARDHGLKARQEARLENATYTAAEVKVLTEAALRLGRREAFDEALGEIQKEARWQTELLNRDNWSQWDQSIDRLRVISGCIRYLSGDGTWEAAPDASEPRTDPSMGMDLPQDSQTASGETRVLLIKPGDVLLVGNLGTNHHPDALSRAIGEFSERTGVKVYAFAADIDIDKIPAAEEAP